MPTNTHDAIVVGGSFAGLSAATQLARARRQVLVVDTAQPRNRFSPAAHGILGHDGKPPAAILETARAQLAAYPTSAFRNDEATYAAARDGGFDVTLASGTVVHARRLVLATGVIDVLPDIPGLRERWGATVLHCPYCHGYETAGGRLGMLATSDASLHVASLLPDWSNDVTLFTNGAFDLTADQRAALAARGVRIDARRVAELVGQGRALAGVQLEDEHGRTLVGLEALFVSPRTRVASPLAEQLGCAFDEAPSGLIVRTDARKETTVPGVYAAGDAALARHNATFASADGVMAGVSAHQSLATA